MIWLVRLGVWLYFVTRLRAAWTALYRWLYESQWQHLKVPLFSSLEAISARQRPDWWRPDGLRQLFDATSSPGYVEAVWSGRAPKPTEGFDCDEFAVYLTAAIDESRRLGVLQAPVLRVRMMSVLWIDAAGKVDGHNVCTYLGASPGSSELAHYWQDYDAPVGPCATYGEVAAAVVAKYAGPGARLAIWLTQDTDCRPFTWGLE